ncbi:insulin-degrading enzyme-like [Acropora millepora]|uniref:insulin-degrading enzyme-like n=1 Tax=Acropora millepora TaxID=45264 RepID=UPI001CF575E9|nr:insulin-degrading enzyme-like [Acropora millepora]
MVCLLRTPCMMIVAYFQGVDVKTSLRDFQQRMYSAQFMTLAVISEEPLDDLEKMVCESFSQIPNNKMTKPSFHEFINPFDQVSSTNCAKVSACEEQTHLVEEAFELIAPFPLVTISKGKNLVILYL